MKKIFINIICKQCIEVYVNKVIAIVFIKNMEDKLFFDFFIYFFPLFFILNRNDSIIVKGKTYVSKRFFQRNETILFQSNYDKFDRFNFKFGVSLYEFFYENA
jgi:hypothetical protein